MWQSQNPNPMPERQQPPKAPDVIKYICGSKSISRLTFTPPKWRLRPLYHFVFWAMLIPDDQAAVSSHP